MTQSIFTTPNAGRFFPTFDDGTRRRLNVHPSVQRSHTNMNWHLWSDGAKRGLKVMQPVGGGVGYYWNYTKQTWEYYGAGLNR